VFLKKESSKAPSPLNDFFRPVLDRAVSDAVFFFLQHLHLDDFFRLYQKELFKTQPHGDIDILIGDIDIHDSRRVTAFDK
jgi:hypothetical protein